MKMIQALHLLELANLTARRPWTGLSVGAGWLLLAGVTVADQVANREIIFDQGLLRWSDTREEVALFGVNYYPPFHWSYADLKTLGAYHEQTIRSDLAHFKRRRLDLLRLHVFDRETSPLGGSPKGMQGPAPARAGRRTRNRAGARYGGAAYRV
jgi:hypothetical protein